MVKGRLHPVIQAVHGKEHIAEEAEEPRFAEKEIFFSSRFLGVLGDRPFLAFRRIHRKTGWQ